MYLQRGEMEMKQIKFLLGDHQIPKTYYNIVPDLPEPPAPPLDPGTMQPVGPEALSAIFPMGLIEQEVSTQREIPIPEPVREVYALYRPTPLVRARRLEQALGTPAHIYFKNEGVSPAGSHKPNTAIAQAYYNVQEGVKRLVTETGAGQWGSALSLARNYFELDVTVYMVRISYEQKPYRRSMVQTYGSEIFSSPSERTAAGRRVLAETPETSGSLGIAISEAVEEAATSDDANYSLG
jgi:tryptophan synthase beta chain